MKEEPVVVNTIDARMLAKMFLAGAKNLEVKKEWINELNVFPVPDGAIFHNYDSCSQCHSFCLIMSYINNSSS